MKIMDEKFIFTEYYFLLAGFEFFNFIVNMAGKTKWWKIIHRIVEWIQGVIIRLWSVEQQCTVKKVLLICHLTCEIQTIIDWTTVALVPSEVLYDILVVLHIFHVWISFPLSFWTYTLQYIVTHPSKKEIKYTLF